MLEGTRLEPLSEDDAEVQDNAQLILQQGEILGRERIESRMERYLEGPV